MISVAPDSCSCRRCNELIAKGERISWVSGPYHLACTPDKGDYEEARAANFYRPHQPATKRWSRADLIAALLIAVVPIAVLTIGLLPGHPYGYFIFLRWIVCGSALLMLAMFHGHGHTGWMYVAGFIALLYNPIFRVHLTREIWMGLNVLTIAAFAVGIGMLCLANKRIGRAAQSV